MNAEKTRLYTFARIIFGFVYSVFFRAKAVGLENFSEDQNCILLGNHIHALDPVTLALFYKPSEVHFIAKESLFKRKWLAALLSKLHAFPVNRGGTDMGAMRQAMQVLRDGHVLGIFPEGHRQPDAKVKRLETGVAVMALRSDVPVIPVYIAGKYRLFGRLRVAVGKPVPLEDLRAGRADAGALEAVKERVMEALEALEPLTNF